MTNRHVPWVPGHPPRSKPASSLTGNLNYPQLWRDLLQKGNMQLGLNWEGTIGTDLINIIKSLIQVKEHVALDRSSWSLNFFF